MSGSGLRLDQVGLEVLGRARRNVVTKDNTTIVDGAGSAEDVAARVEQLHAEIGRTDSDWDREKLQERVAKLAGGVCVIKVGAATEVEMKEKKHRIEDAVSATRAAIEEGIVAGGGSALVHAAKVSPTRSVRRTTRAAGVRIVARALTEAARWIAENRRPGRRRDRGEDRRDGARQRLQRGDRRVRHLISQGVIDPVKVTRSALANASRHC